MDGVLVDNHAWHLEAWLQFCKKYNFTLTEDDFYHKLFGMNNHDTLEFIFGRPLSDLEILKYGQEKEAIFREQYAPFVTPLNGLVAFLEKAKSMRLPLAVATSAPKKNADFTLHHLGLNNYFDQVVDNSLIKNGKPDGEIYLTAASLLKVPPRECIVFEDSLPGIESARNAGMRVVGIATTLSPDQISHADMVVHDFSEIKFDLLLHLDNSYH
jgi:beta-phosphoglucomutase